MQNCDSADADENPNDVIRTNEAQMRNHLGEMVCSTVKETLNDMLDAEADRLRNATRCELSQGRIDGHAGNCRRKLHAKAGEIELNCSHHRCLLCYAVV